MLMLAAFQMDIFSYYIAFWVQKLFPDREMLDTVAWNFKTFIWNSIEWDSKPVENVGYKSYILRAEKKLCNNEWDGF